jgi:hypothetical protein
MLPSTLLHTYNPHRSLLHTDLQLCRGQSRQASFNIVAFQFGGFRRPVQRHAFAVQRRHPQVGAARGEGGRGL